MVDEKKNWIKNAIIYQILIDRFAGCHVERDWMKPQFIGGTIKGIIEKLLYLQELGVTALWISPFYHTTAYHGYHIIDFFDVDPHFGTKDDIQELIIAAHESNFKIIADFVPNHCSCNHPFFLEAQQKNDSPYQKWFYFTDWPDDYLSFLSFSEIPKINLDFQPARDHIIKAAIYWLSYGFDGYRLDHVIGPSHRFWKYFVYEVKKAYPSAVLIGEAWMKGIAFNELRTIKMKGKYLRWMMGNASDYLLRSYQDYLDGVLDFHAQQIIQHHGIGQRQATTSIYKLLNYHYNRFNESFILPIFLDNHDMDRIFFLCHNDRNLLKKLLSIQFSVDQPCIIYYGSEKGMTQQKSVWSTRSHGDLMARQPMNWDTKDTDLFQFYQRLCYKKKIGT